jgi:hypothetical protein
MVSGHQGRSNLPKRALFQVEDLARQGRQVAPRPFMMAARIGRRAVAFRVEMDVLGAKLLQLLEIIPDLLERALAGDALVLREGSISYASEDAGRKRRQRPFLGLRYPAYLRHALIPQPVRSRPDRMPHVAEHDGTPPGAPAAPADPYRRVWRLKRPR